MNHGSSSLFADPSRWVIRRGVPVFPEHTETRVDEHGKEVTVTFDRSKLQEMAQAARRRELETGDACPILIGHIPRGKAAVYEKDLGALAGYAREYRVGKFAGKNTILADFWFKKDKAALADEYPRRSAEVWDDLLIDPVCLLKRTPRHDLGLLTADHQPDVQDKPQLCGDGPSRCLTYARGTRCRIYQMEDTPVDDSIKQQLADLLQQAIGLLTGGAPDTGAAGGAPAGAGGGSLPADDMAPQQYSREAFDRLQNQLRKQAKDIERAQKAADEHRRLYEKSRRKEKLTTLKEEEHLAFDVDEELEDVAHLDDAAFSRHLAKIPRKYARDEEKIIPTVHRPRQQTGSTSKELMEKRRDYAREHKCSYDEAVQKVPA